MSKFWAMLRDSYKEAVDGYIMLVMFVLIGLVAVLIASLSAEPVPAVEAVPQVVRLIGQTSQPGLQAVTGDRGRANRQAYFVLAQSASDVVAGEHPAGRPWAGPVTFTVTYQSGGGGFEAETDADGKLKPESIKRNSIMAGDAFKEAVRYWAAKPGEKKPAYTDALAEEFVAAHIRGGARLDVTKVTKVTRKPAANAGAAGMLGNLFAGSGPPAFEVTAAGGERVGWAHKPSVLFGVWSAEGGAPLGEMVYLVESTLLNRFGAWVILLAGVVVTAGFIPNMIRKGAIDLMVSKPVPRPLILLYKYLGGLLFVFFLTAAAVGSVWLALGLRTGVWSPAVWWCVPSITAYFAILYACSTLVGVLTRNAIVSIVMTIVFWFAIFLIGLLITLTNQVEAAQEMLKAQDRQARVQKDKADKPPAEDEVVATPEKSWWLWSLETANRASPRINDLDELTRQQISNDLQNKVRFEGGKTRDGLQWAEVAAVSAVWLVLFLGLATLRFVTRSY